MPSQVGARQTASHWVHKHCLLARLPQLTCYLVKSLTPHQAQQPLPNLLHSLMPLLPLIDLSHSMVVFHMCRQASAYQFLAWDNPWHTQLSPLHHLAFLMCPWPLAVAQDMLQGLLLVASPPHLGGLHSTQACPPFSPSPQQLPANPRLASQPLPAQAAPQWQHLPQGPVP